MPKKNEFVKFNNFERKMKSSFMIYADFKSILVADLQKQKAKSNPFLY